MENDLARAIEIAESKPELPSQTLGRSSTADTVDETLPEILRRTAEPPRSSFYQPQPEPEPVEEDSDDSVTIAKIDSPHVSPRSSDMPMKIESSSPSPTPRSFFLREPKSRLEVMQMSPHEFGKFHDEAERRFDNVKAEMLKRVGAPNSASGELSGLTRDQLKRYRSIAKADWELAQQAWDWRALEQSQANAVIVDGAYASDTGLLVTRGGQR